MTHYPGHKREAFHAFIDRCVQEILPPTVTVEVDHKPQEVPPDEFLRDFLNCDDTIPHAYRERIAHLTDRGELGMTYAEAAHALLVEFRMMLPTDSEPSNPIAHAIHDEARYVEHAKEEAERAKRQHRRLEPWFREQAKRQPEAIRTLAAQVENGTLRAVFSEAEITLRFELYAGEEYIGGVALEREHYIEADEANEILENGSAMAARLDIEEWPSTQETSTT